MPQYRYENWPSPPPGWHPPQILPPAMLRQPYTRMQSAALPGLLDQPRLPPPVQIAYQTPPNLQGETLFSGRGITGLREDIPLPERIAWASRNAPDLLPGLTYQAKKQIEEPQRQAELRKLLAEIEGQESEAAVRRQSLKPVELPEIGPTQREAIPFVTELQKEKAAAAERRRLLTPEQEEQQIRLRKAGQSQSTNEINELRADLLRMQRAGAMTGEQRVKAIFGLRELAAKRARNFDDLEAFGKPIDEIMEQEAQRIYGKSVAELRGGTQEQPKAAPAGKPAATGQKVQVISPQGQKGTIPSEDLEEALKQGYRLAE